MSPGQDSGLDGHLLRELREESGLTLRELSEKTGLSTSLISQLERGVTSPSLQSIRLLAEALEVSIFQLLAADNRGYSYVPADRRRKLVMQHGEISYELLSPDTKRRLEVWLGTLSPGVTSGDEPSVHPSEEFILVLSGQMEIEISGQRQTLGPGDAIQYDGSQPHMIWNHTDEPLRFISALTPPTL
ncbi:MAG: MerR family transcriptional regulator [Pseudonocardiales bacterium]|nr:MAG: MerR family transcriptional regulator [Pseudonocardiales bacterium]